jgi:hypothetical protein
MPNDHQINRRMLLSLLLGTGIAVLVSDTAYADGGGSGESGSGGDDGGSGSDDGSGSGSNSGSGGSGSGGSGDDGGGSDDNEDDGGDDNSGSSGNSGSGSGNSGRKGRDQDKARDAVLKGKVIPLSRAFELLKKRNDGRVIEVLLTEKGSRLDYRFKLVDAAGNVVSITMDARTGRIRGFLGI